MSRVGGGARKEGGKGRWEYEKGGKGEEIKKGGRWEREREPTSTLTA